MPILKAGERHTVTLTLNGRPATGYAESRTLLSDFIRHELGATGTHVGCEHGVCGACTVRVDGKAVRSCLTLAVQAAGCQVETVEGLAPRGTLSILQEAFKRHHAVQCGYCTPGILMSLTHYLETNPEATEMQLREVIGGHLCRCTGYTQIVAAAVDVATRLREAARKP
ncbi:MAG: (2Fe-2S)-binding protein [Betaproteobacteria bacterium]|nr:(2Fe-2S)-binding protein [Betaproteobacteria bacterium]